MMKTGRKVGGGHIFCCFPVCICGRAHGSRAVDLRMGEFL